MKRKRRSGLKKDKIIMLAASVFALTALTMTGVYVNQKNTKNQNDGYEIDLTQLNEEVNRQVEEIGEQVFVSPVPSDDLDVEIIYEETNAGEVLLPEEDRNILNPPADTNEMVTAQQEEDFREMQRDEFVSEEEVAQNTEVAEINEDIAQEPAAAEEPVTPVLDFSDNDTLAWPIVGNVLLNYSMDKVVYFSTLEQYRYNPSIVISAVVGEPITAAADGKVLSIADNVETGGTVVCDLGNGYELTYGQLENFAVSEGDYVAKGDILGFVAEPSIFYSVEGSNVYFKLTKDGEPLDPMTLME